mgnify:CR=1 FL=1
MPLVEKENTNISPVVGGLIVEFIAPTINVGNGSEIIENSTRLTHKSAGGTSWSSSLGEGSPISFVTFANTDTTPSVKGWSWGRANNVTPTTITDFDDGYEGQKLALMFSTGSTTITHGTNIFLTTGANITPSINDTLNIMRIDGKWYEI